MSIEDKHFYVGPDDEPDKYRLLSLVSRGGEGELWEADMVVAGGRERVAVKILHDDHSADVARWKARWAEQIDLLRLVSHPSVVGVHAHFEGSRLHRPGEHHSTDRALYMVMNWIEGQDLRDWVPQHSRPEDRRLGMRYLAQVATVLDWLHAGATPSGRPILHGDVTPANVIINPDGLAVLVDFGLIRVARHVTAVAAGTPGYTAPEVIRGGEYSTASDRYAFGGLSYYVLTGVHPPEDPQQLHSGLAAIAGLADHPATNAELATIFSVDPAARPTCTDWLRRLRLHSSTAPVRPTPLPPLAPGAPTPVSPGAGHVPTLASRHGTKRAIAIAGALLAAVVLAVTLINLVPRDANPDSATTNNNQTEPLGNTGTPTNGSPSQAAARPPDATYLTNLEPVGPYDDSKEWTSGPVTVDKRDYAYGLLTEGEELAVNDTDCRSQIEYALSGRYVRLRSIAGFADNTSVTTATSFKILLDNTVALNSTIQLRKPVKIDLSVSGVVRLGIFVEYRDCDHPTIALGDPVLESPS